MGSPLQLDPEADRAVISVNPKAGARSPYARVERLARLLERAGLGVETFTDLDRVAQRANALHAERRLRALIGVGGDGTAAELVNRTVPGVPLTLLPSGNENLLARYLGLGKSPESVSKTIAGGRIARLDVGKANGRIFLLMLGCGFDAEVVERVHARRKKHIRSGDYFKPILESIRSYRFPELHVSQDAGDALEPGRADNAGETAATAEGELPALCRWLFAFNLPCYAGGLKMAPHANGTDGLLDICTFAGGSALAGLRYVAAVYFGRHQRMTDCTIARTRKMTVTSQGRVPYELDGDPGGLLPVEIEAVPARLTMIVPFAFPSHFPSSERFHRAQ
jgi:diacylglycerol kinase family enzyme